MSLTASALARFGQLLKAGLNYRTALALADRVTEDDLASSSLLPAQTGLGGKFLSTDGTSASWEDAPTAAVTSVATRTGDVILSKADVSLGQVDNTSDASKPISTAQQAALDLKANLAGATFTGPIVVPTPTANDNPTTKSYVDTAIAGVGGGGGGSVTSVAGKTGAVTLVKGDVGLGNVDNTSDINKPVSSATSTALAAKADLVGGLIPSSQLPSIALVNVVTVASQAAMLALTTAQVQSGDVAIRTDGAGSFILTAADPSVLANWKLLNAPTDAVTSVAGRTGTIVLGPSDVGLGNVNNTSDVNKPVSTAQQAALDAKAALAGATFTGAVTVPTPTATGHAATKSYVDTAISGVSGGASKPFAADYQLYSGVAAPVLNGVDGGIWIPYATTITKLFGHCSGAPTGAGIVIDLVVPAIGAPAPTQVGTPTTQAFTSTNPTVTFPTGANAAGNVILIVGTTTNQVSGTPPTGWNLLVDQFGGSSPTFGRLFAWWKPWVSGDGTSVAMPTMSGAPGNSLVHCVAWSGADAITFTDAIGSLQDQFVAAASNLGWTAGAITTTLANEIVVGIIAQEGNAAGNTSWSGLTEITDQAGSNVTLSIATATQAAAGGSAAISATMAAASNFMGLLFSIKPVSYTVAGTVTIPAGSLSGSATVSIPETADTLLNANIRSVGSTYAGKSPALGLLGT